MKLSFKTGDRTERTGLVTAFGYLDIGMVVGTGNNPS
jgi:hypothetical protein